ncbi:DUF1080 domain-containing protein [Rhodopirellula sp. SWK7]|uniref:3-keto-disaccharide hydrolase n=1 Tax=Rhodopirellula sp. SWK7 TaxID=595460 RepID=UPI0006934FD1|nr:DUF1080 domain-containing protein [Rhodopirellula sp. SWK7]
MPRIVCAVGLLTVLTVATVARGQALVDNTETGFVSMFNGEDLTGWSGQPGAWHVEDGANTGESTPEKPCVASHYLYWTGGEPANFIMRCQIKLSGGNSGIQFRSEKRPNFDTFGYQADFDMANQWTGCLFQHVRGAVVTRGTMATVLPDGTRQEEQFASMQSLVPFIKPNTFNDYEIEAVGSRVTLRLNGQLMCEVNDMDSERACRKGVIALQMHQGDPMKVQFKNLGIKLLTEESGPDTNE